MTPQESLEAKLRQEIYGPYLELETEITSTNLEQELTLIDLELQRINIEKQIFIYVDEINRLRLESKELQEKIDGYISPEIPV